MKKLYLCLSVIVFFSTSSFSQEQLLNPGFTSNLNDWTVSGNLSWTSFDGGRVNFNGGNLPPNGIISQDFTSISSQTYTVNVDYIGFNNTFTLLLEIVDNTNSNVLLTQTLSGINGNTSVDFNAVFAATSTDTKIRITDTSLTTAGGDISVGTASITLNNTLNFDGTDDVVNCGDIDALDGASAFTMELWVNFDDLSGNNGLIGKGTDGSNRIVMQFFAGNTVFFVVNDANGSGDTGQGSVAHGMSINTWYHIAMVFDGTQTGNSNRLKAYIDGVQQTLSLSGTVPALTNDNAANLELGTANGIGNIDGQIDEVRIWNKALTAAEITGLYNKVISNPTTLSSCLVANYQLNEGSGMSASDASGNGNTGTLQNGPTWVSSTAPFTSESSNSCAALLPLPVELVSFKAKLQDRTTRLTWQTASEINNQGFEIEHSTDGKNWRAISFVDGNGTSYELTNYQFLHQSPVSGINYYRLKQIDFDGNYEYSKTVPVNVEKGGNIVVYPNPSTGQFNISGIDIQNASVSIYNTVGQLVKEEILTQSVLDVSDLVDGLYYLMVKQGAVVYEVKVLKE